MGQCYSVNLKIKLKPNSEKRAADALKTHMFKDDRTNYCFDEFAALGVGTEELDDLIRICLAGWKLTTYFTDESYGWKNYENDFDCSYGWESVLGKIFEALAPFLEDQADITLATMLTDDLLKQQNVTGKKLLIKTWRTKSLYTTSI